MAVTNGLAHGDDVGDGVLGFEHPEMRAGAAEAGLDFVGDGDPARGVDGGESLLQISGRQNDLAAASQRGFAEESRETTSLTGGIGD